MSKNVLSIMEMDELDSSAEGENIPRVVGMAATPPNQVRETAGSFFEVL
jgi:hypothetical protein